MPTEQGLTVNPPNVKSGARANKEAQNEHLNIKCDKPNVKKKPKKVSKDEQNIKAVLQATNDCKALDQAPVEKTPNGKQTVAASVVKTSLDANVDKDGYGNQTLAGDENSTYAEIVTNNNKSRAAENIVRTLPETVYSAVEFRDKLQGESDSD